MASVLPIIEPAAVPVRNAWCLLLYAWDLAQWRDRWDGAVEAATDLRGLLARVLVDCMHDLLRRQLGRTHIGIVSEIRGIRGRIDFGRSLKRRSFSAGRAVCAFSNLDVDTPRNRILRGTLDRLLRNDLLGVGAKPEAVAALRHDLRSLVRVMNGVKLQPIQASDFSRLQLGRNDMAYLLPLAICRLVFRHEIPSEEAGQGFFAALLRDQVAFQVLFERFVRNFFRFHRRDARVEAQELSWFDENQSPFVPRMRTDITLEWGDPVERRLVIDTKYYGNALSARFENAEKFHASNLYQLYAYLRTQEHRGPAYRDANGALLYPVTNRRLDERMRVQGHEMHIRTIDLAAPWTELQRDLLRLLD